LRASQLALTTKEFDKARLGLEEILKRHAGYLGESNARAPIGAGRVLDATLRVPVGKLDAVMADLKKLGRVESESQRGEEVSKQYTDLEARLTNARNAEHRLTDLLRQRTGKLADVLAVELEIDRVRGEIERMDAEKNALLNRVDFAIVNVKLAEDYQAQLDMAPDSKLSQFRNAAVEGFRDLVDGLFSVALSLASYGPSLLVWSGFLFFPVRFAWRRWRALAYSSRSATVQSICVARRNGTYTAAGEMSRIAAAAAASVSGSRGCTWNRSASRNRPRTRLPAIPMASPKSTGVMLCISTSLPMPAGVAPIAMRIPISRTREATRFESTP
jgi:hypothetical protein